MKEFIIIFKIVNYKFNKLKFELDFSILFLFEYKMCDLMLLVYEFL